MAKSKVAARADITTVIVQSNVHTGGMSPGEQAEVEYNAKTKELIGLGLWTLLVPIEAPVESTESADLSSYDVPGLPYGDSADTD